MFFSKLGNIGKIRARKSSLKTWLFVIALNTVRDFYLTLKQPAELLEETLSDPLDIHKLHENKQLASFVLDRMRTLRKRSSY